MPAFEVTVRQTKTFTLQIEAEDSAEAKDLAATDLTHSEHPDEHCTEVSDFTPVYAISQ